MITPQEHKVSDILQTLFQKLSDEKHLWKYSVEGCLTIFQESIKGNDLKQKFSEVKNILSMYGGMGSINDQGFNEDTNKLKDQLYAYSFELLKEYWKDLGNEFHTDDEFLILAIGTKVKFINNSIRYFDNDQRPVFANFERKGEETVWKVISNQNRDITNMPTYGIVNNGTYSSARHNSLTIF
jgi:hypothetical protein